MPRYSTIPVDVDAIQWDGEIDQARAFAGDRLQIVGDEVWAYHPVCPGFSTKMEIGDWLVIDAGVLEVWTNEQFVKRFRPAEA